MHVRVAWEIYHHQQKQTAEGKPGLGAPGAKDPLLRPPGHLFPPPPGPRHDLGGYPPGFLPPPHIGNFFKIIFSVFLDDVVINC